MKDIIEFLKQKRNIKYSLWMIIFGLIFAFSFLANQAQIPQILEKPLKIIPGTKEAKQYQVSGWQGSRAKGKRSVLKVSLLEKRSYRMVIKAFSCSPPDARDQRIEVHFNDVALGRLKFKKTSKWQKSSINIPSYFLQETNTIKLVYTQDTHLSPITFDYLEFRNYVFRWGGLYLLFDPPAKKRINYLNPQVLGYSLGFAILFLFFWLFHSRFLFFAVKMKFSRAIKIDLMSWLPSSILFSFLALISFFSSYHFVYSFKTFFILALVPTGVLKLFLYKDLLPRLIIKIINSVFRFILRAIEKTGIEAKRVFSFLKIQGITFRKFFIRYHKTNLSSALILDFMLLLILAAFLLMTEETIFRWGGEQVTIFAYWLLAIGVVIKLIQLVEERKTGDEKRFIRIKNRWKVPFKKIILGLVSILLILLVSLFLWLILPGKRAEVTQFTPQETFTFLTLKIDLKDPGTSELINNFDWKIRWGMRFLGPVETAAFAVPAANKEEPDYLLLVKNNRLIKIARLFRRSIDRAIIDGEPFEKIDYRGCPILHLKGPGKEDEVSSYTLFKDVALASNNLSLLKASLDQSGKETSFISGEALSDFQGLQRAGEAMFFIDNSHSKLSRAMKSLEEKSAHAILPTVDSLNYLGGYFDILDGDRLNGSLFFKYEKSQDIKKGKENIYFLAGSLKRLCKANGLNLEEEIIVDNHYLRLNFKLSGLKSLISNLLARGKKQKK